MQPDDPAIRWIQEPELGLAGRMYLPAVFQGLTTTARHLMAPKKTVQFPEERPEFGLLDPSNRRIVGLHVSITSISRTYNPQV